MRQDLKKRGGGCIRAWVCFMGTGIGDVVLNYRRLKPMGIQN